VKLIRNLLDTLMLALLAVAMAACFRYFGGLEFPASLSLGVCFTIAATWLFGLWKIAVFEPYKITIYINFDTLRDDIGMSKSDKTPEMYEPLHDIFEFTAINAAVFSYRQRYTGASAAEFNLADRIARSDEEFRSRIAFAAKIPGAFAREQFENLKRRDPHPRFFFREVLDGYQFGIQVLPNWWSEHSKQLSKPIRDLPVTFGGEVMLASIPSGYLPDHVRRWEKPVSFFYPFDWKQRRWKSRFEKLGWILNDDDPQHLNHRYLSITFSHI